jgi:AcrR family transcriptional regulator
LHFRVPRHKKSTNGRRIQKAYEHRFLEVQGDPAVKKGDATRCRILDEAARQAAVRGLQAITLSDVAEGAGLSKSGLFKHFTSKEAMQLAVLGQTLDRFIEFIWTPCARLPGGRGRLEAIFARWLDWAEVENAAGGCLVIAASIELDDQPGSLRDLLLTRQKLWTAILAREVRSLRDPPVPAGEADIAVFQMKSFILGHNDMRRLLRDDGARRAATASFETLMDQLAAPAAGAARNLSPGTA